MKPVSASKALTAPSGTRSAHAPPWPVMTDTTPPGCSAQSARNVPLAAPWSCLWVGSEAMSLHLEALSKVVSPGAHAVLVCDGAGWH